MQRFFLYLHWTVLFLGIAVAGVHCGGDVSSYEPATGNTPTATSCPECVCGVDAGGYPCIPPAIRNDGPDAGVR